MRQLPKKPKYRDFQKLRFRPNWYNGDLKIWSGGIVLYTRCRLAWRHFEMIRLRLAWGMARKRRLSKKERYKKKLVKRGGINYFKRHKSRVKFIRCFWYTGFPHLLVSRKVQGGRMGKGKGSIKTWYYLAHEGKFLILVRGSTYMSLRILLRNILMRLPARGRVVFRYTRVANYSYETACHGSSWWR